jgi:hypothetical protein
VREVAVHAAQPGELVDLAGHVVGLADDDRRAGEELDVAGIAAHQPTTPSDERQPRLCDGDLQFGEAAQDIVQRAFGTGLCHRVRPVETCVGQRTGAKT